MRAPCLPLLGLLLLLVPVRGVAAGPSSAWQAGKALERAGEPARALDRYLGALEGRRDGRVLRAAQSVAPAAVDQLFASAGAAELELRFVDSLAVLDRLALLRERLDRRAVEVPRLAELDATRARTAAAGAEHAVRSAEGLTQDGLLAAAIAQLGLASQVLAQLDPGP